MPDRWTVSRFGRVVSQEVGLGSGGDLTPEVSGSAFVLRRYCPRTSFDMCIATNMWGTSTTAPIFKSPASEQRT